MYEYASLPADTPRGSSRQHLRLQTPVVAVLPIHNEDVEGSVRTASEVIRSDLVHRLSRVAQLRVVDAKVDNGETPEFAATYMIETGVHQLGDRVRVFADLIDVTTWNVVKSHKRTVEAEALFDVSEELANEVARSVEVELIIGEPAALYDELDDPEAIEKIYLGWYHLGTNTEQGWSRAVELFGDVAKSHPDQPYGHTLSAFANWVAASNEWGTDPEATLELSRAQARRAREVGDPTGMAPTVEAAILLSRGELEEALSELEGIDIVRPTCDVTYGLQGSIRRYLGDWNQSIDLLDVAMRLTAVNKPWYPTVQACSLFGDGRVEQAASLAETVLEHQPNNIEAFLVLAAAQVELGLDRRAHATIDTLKDRFPGVDPE
ncbi:MAG TPA: tetratricopeptide repeat protein, partial [Acidimicrobiia bacterium]|nr:tetratricopeptide repeat protein [Acidimicrobiia bacterium]